MKASEYLKDLQALVDLHGDLDLVYAINEEGNAFHKVEFEPSAGHLKGDFFDTEGEVNSICIN